MKILLLGKNGLLGSELSSTFKKHDENDFYALSHADLDITDKDVVYQTLKDLKPHLVINAAAFTYVDECEAKKQFVMSVNGEANGEIAKMCAQLGAHLVYFSTDYVFNGNNDEGYEEDDTPSPINTYGESKLLGEKLIQENTSQFYIVRASWLFGMHGRNFVTTMLDLAKTKDKITVVDDQIGKPTYSVDLAEAVYKLIKFQQPESGIYHLVNENETSWFDFAEKILDLTKANNVDLVRIKSDQLDRPAKRPMISILRNTKLPHLRSHEEALYDYLSQLNVI